MTDGDFITNPKFKKVSCRFRYYDPLNDSDVSEDYDTDAFFEGKCPEDLPMEMESARQTEATLSAPARVTGMGARQTMLPQVPEQGLNHPNQFLAQMSQA